MRYIKFFTLICLLFCTCLLKSNQGSIENMNRINENIEIVFYYNPVVYTDFRTEKAVKNGAYEIKKIFHYKDLSDITCISDVLKEQPVYLDDSEKEAFYANLIECLCIITKDKKDILTFTYSENFNKNYALCNGKLIRRNKIYDKFADEILKIIKSEKEF